MNNEYIMQASCGNCRRVWVLLVLLPTLGLFAQTRFPGKSYPSEKKEIISEKSGHEVIQWTQTRLPDGTPVRP